MNGNCLVFWFILVLITTRALMGGNICGITYRHYKKVSDALRNTGLQQSHIYFEVQIYTTTHRYGHQFAVLRYGVRICNGKTLINT